MCYCVCFKEDKFKWIFIKMLKNDFFVRVKFDYNFRMVVIFFFFLIDFEICICIDV